VEYINLLQEHELWANRVSTRIIGVFCLCSIPIFFILQNVSFILRVFLSLGSLLVTISALIISVNKQTSKYTKYALTIILNTFGFLMTVTMGEGNRSVPFYFFTILALCLIYLNPKVILMAAGGTIVSHVIMMLFFSQQIFALHEPTMYIFVAFIYLIYSLTMFTIAIKSSQLLDTLKKREDEQSKLNQNLTEIQRQIAVASAQLRNTSNTLAKQAGELLSSSQETASGMEEMARMVDVETNEVTKVSYNVMQINSIAEKIKKQADELAADFNKTEDLSKRGAELMYSTINGMYDVSMQINEVADATQRLKVSSLKIEDILTIMNGIAEQTTLLSLNANIEAARAGNAGRGFAVVATEISKLAVQSAQATEEIKQITGTTLLDVDKVLNSTATSLAIVQKGAEESNTASGEIENIMINIYKNSEQITEIYRVLENLVAMNNAIMDGANSLAGIAEETSAGTEEIAATTQTQATNVDKIAEQSRALEQMALALDHLVNQTTS